MTLELIQSAESVQFEDLVLRFVHTCTEHIYHHPPAGFTPPPASILMTVGSRVGSWPMSYLHMGLCLIKTHWWSLLSYTYIRSPSFKRPNTNYNFNKSDSLLSLS